MLFYLEHLLYHFQKYLLQFIFLISSLNAIKSSAFPICFLFQKKYYPIFWCGLTGAALEFCYRRRSAKAAFPFYFIIFVYMFIGKYPLIVFVVIYQFFFCHLAKICCSMQAFLKILSTYKMLLDPIFIKLCFPTKAWKAGCFVIWTIQHATTLYLLVASPYPHYLWNFYFSSKHP